MMLVFNSWQLLSSLSKCNLVKPWSLCELSITHKTVLKLSPSLFLIFCPIIVYTTQYAKKIFKNRTAQEISNPIINT